ncbi:acyltransferase family protein [Streptomyces sp. NBC_00388]|uniref:acyltransferase family protein n=1 Tax=Streptomyces sp. NBC_00388 TaxID=2975735 RepID=UPI002E22D48A
MIPANEVEARKNRLPTLTGMRFLAAFLVFLCHAAFQGFLSDSALQGNLQDWLLKAGWAGVQFFFILSGFVLTWAARPGDTVTAFWRRRAAKLYPVNLVACLMAVVLLLATGGALTAERAIPNLLLVQSWLPDYPAFDGLNPPSWSLCCEVLFYALFPFLLKLVNRIQARRLWWSAGGVFAFMLVMPSVATLLPLHPMLADITSFPQFWLVYAFPVTRVADFLLGILLARIVLSGQWIRIGLLPATAVAAVSYVITVVAPVLYSMVATMTIGLVLVIGAGATADLSKGASALRGPRMLWLGEVSFSFYMVHVLVLTYGHRLLGGGAWSPPVALAVSAALFAVALVVAALLHRFVERPAMKYLSRKRVRPLPVLEVEFERLEPLVDSNSRA